MCLLLEKVIIQVIVVLKISNSQFFLIPVLQKSNIIRIHSTTNRVRILLCISSRFDGSSAFNVVYSETRLHF